MRPFNFYDKELQKADLMIEIRSKVEDKIKGIIIGRITFDKIPFKIRTKQIEVIQSIRYKLDKIIEY